MKKQTLLTLLIVFVVLILVSVLFFWFDFRTTKDEKIETPFNFAEVQTELVDKIEFKSAGNQVVLEKNDSKWKADNNLASNSEVSELLNNLVSIKIGKIVSSNPANHGRFLITNELAAKVTLRIGDINAGEYLIGKSAQGVGEFFIRKPNSDDVYEAKGALGIKARYPIDEWREKNIFSLNINEVKEMSFNIHNKKNDLEKLDGSWKTKTGYTSADFANEKMSQLIEVFSPLRARGFLTEQQIEEFVDLKISQKSNITIGDFEAELYDRDELMWWLKVKGRDDYFILPEGVVEKIQKLLN